MIIVKLLIRVKWLLYNILVYLKNAYWYDMLGNSDFIWKFEIGSNLLFGKLKNFKFEFELNSIIAFKVVKIEDLKMAT